MKKFDEFLKKGIIRKQSPNKDRAFSLIKEAYNKKQFLGISLKSVPKEQMNANFIVDYCYDIIMELIRAKMFGAGYNTASSHEAEIAYLENLGFSESDIRFMNELRYFRNGTKYYGTILDNDYANKVLNFMNKMYSKLKN